MRLGGSTSSGGDTSSGGWGGSSAAPAAADSWSASTYAPAASSGDWGGASSTPAAPAADAWGTERQFLQATFCMCGKSLRNWSVWCKTLCSDINCLHVDLPWSRLGDIWPSYPHLKQARDPPPVSLHRLGIRVTYAFLSAFETCT
jgi:hypothetical protein